jgi:Cof subfamily protein (haloacid dehalogenase superfamily)
VAARKGLGRTPFTTSLSSGEGEPPLRSPKRLIGIDLDGTLLRGGEAHPDDLAALHAARAAGIPVIVATGRSHFSSRPVVAELGLDEMHVCYDGAWIVTREGSLLRDLRVPVEIAREVLRRCRDIDLAVRVFLTEEVLMNREPAPDERFFKYRPFERIDPQIGDTLGEGPMQLVIVHRDDIRAFHREFAGTHVERDLHWMQQGNDPETPHLWALHLFNKGGTKDAALAQLCEQWDIDRSEVIVFGDGPNDVSMLAWAGTGVSFPWAVKAAQSAARLITAPDDPHPIASTLEAWLAGNLKV